MHEINQDNIDHDFSLPDKKAEMWRKVDINRIKKIINLPKGKLKDNKKDIIKHNIPKLADDSFRIILGSDLNTIDSSQFPKGMKMLNSLEIRKNINKTINQLNHNNDWSLDLNNAFSKSLLAIKVSKENKSSLEIVIPEEIDCLKATRLLIIVEQKSQLDLLEIFTGSNNAAHSNLIEIHVCNDAIVNHGLIAIGKNNASLLSKIAVSQEINSHYSLIMVQEGWNFSRIEPEIVQINGKAKTEIQGLQVASKNQELSTFSIIKFNGPEGSLNQLQKAIVKNQSHSIFNGIIEVPQIAQKTNAAQLSRNLLISEKGQIDTKPELRIIADDVRCTHGATISQMEEEELFYLQSRGISAEESVELILNGYTKDIINKLPLEARRWSSLIPLLDQ